MYDVILISTHYNYDKDGAVIPYQSTGSYDDLSYIIPSGIIHIAQYLHNCGFKVRVVHIPHELNSLQRIGKTEDLTKNPVEQILRKYPANVCGVQVHYYLYCGGAVFISNLYKKLFPESKIFLGGYMATACWKEFLNFSKSIDGIILGEGEKTLKIIIEKLLDSKYYNLNDVSGIAYRGKSADEIIYNRPLVSSVLEMHEMPVIYPDSPPFANIIWQKRHFLNISRGLCPEKCSFCVGNNIDINSRAYQTLKIDNILEQLRVYQEFGFHELFLGENQFLNISFMTELIERIIRENFNLYFELETHPVILESKELLDKMIQAKFLRFTMGCESGSNSLLKRMGRKSNSRQIMGSVKRIVESGGIVLTSWISNLPGETAFDFKETQQLMSNVVKVGGLIYWVENLHVLPGSKLYENPQFWDIEVLLNNLEDWIRWSIFSKKYVDFDEVYEEPQNYLTHLNRNISAKEMIDRFYSNRKLALSLTPEMKSNLENRCKNLNSDIAETEMQTLDWYEKEGWTLWLF
jgi:radical SAM superfamily enzyme YgiQ (UPF0313 family)